MGCKASKATSAEPVTVQPSPRPDEAVPDPNKDFYCLVRERLSLPENEIANLDKSINGRFCSKSAVLIADVASVESLTQVSVYMLLAVMHELRRLVPAALSEVSGRVVKANGTRFFCALPSAEDALRGALAIETCVRYLPEQLQKHPIHFRHGIAVGDILFLPDDYYGDAVNIASKLGEDLAHAGEMFVAEDSINADELPADLGHLTLAKETRSISSVQLSFWSVTQKTPRDNQIGLQAIIPSTPTTELQKKLSRLSSHICEHGDVSAGLRSEFEHRGVVLVSDMSGFTRLTKKYGILFFLSLISKMREICGPVYAKHGGTVVDTEADNFLVLFPNVSQAVKAVATVLGYLAEFNKGKPKDNRILICIGIAEGLLINAGNELYGETMDTAMRLGEDLAGPEELLLPTPLWDTALKDDELRPLLEEGEGLVDEATGIAYHVVSFRQQRQARESCVVPVSQYRGRGLINRKESMRFLTTAAHDGNGENESTTTTTNTTTNTTTTTTTPAAKRLSLKGRAANGETRNSVSFKEEPVAQ
eukprot:Rmarinus@m.26221